MRILAYLMSGAAVLTGLTGCDDLKDPGAFVRPGGDGETPLGDGPLSIAWKPAVRVNRLLFPDFTMDVFYPGLPDGSFDFTLSPYPVVIFVQGGNQPLEEYYFLAERLATWGMVVALPSYPLNLAFFGPIRASAALDRLTESMEEDSFWKGGLDLDRTAVGGHSLGGVVAGWAADSDPRFSTLFYLASYPSDEEGGDFLGATLSVAGTLDCAVTVEESEAGLSSYGAPRAFVTLEGMTHYQFTGSDEEDLKSCPPGIPLETAHQNLSSVIVPFLQVYLSGDTSALPWLESPPPGVTVELSVEEGSPPSYAGSGGRKSMGWM